MLHFYLKGEAVALTVKFQCKKLKTFTNLCNMKLERSSRGGGYALPPPAHFPLFPLNLAEKLMPRVLNTNSVSPLYLAGKMTSYELVSRQL